VTGLERDRPRLAIAEQYGCTAIIGDASAWAKSGDGLAPRV